VEARNFQGAMLLGDGSDVLYQEKRELLSLMEEDHPVDIPLIRLIIKNITYAH
jgi:hypothetical protein